MWMMYNIPGITKDEAYDTVRREFYALRQQEEVERRIAKEEAQMVGAYFGKSFLQVGMQLEDQQFEKWKKWAGKEISNIQTERSEAYTSFGVDEDSDGVDIDGELEEETA